MRIYKSLLLFLGTILISGCISNQMLKSKIESRDGIEMLYGKVNRDQLFFDFPEWKNEYNSYTTYKQGIDSLNSLFSPDYKIDIFLGTWCDDSKREVPRVLKILDQMKIVQETKISIFAVDRKKKLENGFAEQNNINRVATFIFRNSEQEIGRIVEYPVKSLESDMINILQNKSEN